MEIPQPHPQILNPALIICQKSILKTTQNNGESKAISRKPKNNPQNAPCANMFTFLELTTRNSKFSNGNFFFLKQWMVLWCEAGAWLAPAACMKLATLCQRAKNFVRKLDRMASRSLMLGSSMAMRVCCPIQGNAMPLKRQGRKYALIAFLFGGVGVHRRALTGELHWGITNPLPTMQPQPFGG